MSITINATRLPRLQYTTEKASVVVLDDAKKRPAKSVVSQIVPVQDLHGYANPWPAGGGKNKWNPDTSTAGYFDNEGTYHNQGPTNLEYYSDFIEITAETVTVGYFNYASGDAHWYAACFYDENKTFMSRSTSATANSYTQQTVPSGAKYFRANARTFGHGLEYCFAANGAVTTYSPYSNLCPISGRSEVSVTRTGKNLVRNTGTGRTNAGITYTVNEDGSVKASGTASGTSWWRGSTTLSDWVFIKAGTYHLSGGKSNNQMVYMVGKMIDGTPINNTSIGNVYDKGTGLTFTLPKDGYLNYQIQIANGEVVDDTFYPMIRKAGTDVFEPYQCQTVTIQLGQTVYGGTVDLVSGELVVDRAYLEKDSAGMNNSANYPGWTNSGIRAIVGAGISGNRVASLNVGNRIGINTNGTNDILFLDKGVYGLSQDEWKALDMTIQVVVALKESITYQLTPQQFQTLLGDNTVWADAGLVSLTYAARRT